MVVTNFHIYMFNKKSKLVAFTLIRPELKRVIRIQYLDGLTKNLQQGSSEFVVHVQNEQDYRCSCNK